jgi:hypothetical protein
MPSALELMGHGMMNRSNLTPASALGMMVADDVVTFGASVGLGEVYARYHDKWYGKYAPEMTAGVFGLIEGILTLFVGPGFASGIAGSASRVGIAALGMELGLNHARKDMGVAVVKVPAGTDVKSLKSGSAVPASTMLGGLGTAPAGRGLAWDHVQELAASH